MSDPGFNIRVVEWSDSEPAIREIREQVFIQEQDVPVEEEWDGRDPECLHLLAEADGRAIATARMLEDGKIGRMAVFPAWRGRGVGTAMLRLLLELARHKGISRVILDAQTRALGFYRRLGFEAEGEEFLDAGIPHYRMFLDLKPGS